MHSSPPHALNFDLGSLHLAPSSKLEHECQPFSWRRGEAPASRPSHPQGSGHCFPAGWFWSPAASFSSGPIQCLRNRSRALNRGTGYEIAAGTGGKGPVQSSQSKPSYTAEALAAVLGTCTLQPISSAILGQFGFWQVSVWWRAQHKAPLG